ncbi:MAG: hypothetical protein AAFX05_11085, partial [Planctomycetota bacterium]
SSAAAIAEEQGFDYVLASITPDTEVMEGTMDAVARDILGRPVLVLPEGTDITEDVRADLKLE